jgi:hypothetical protein
MAIYQKKYTLEFDDIIKDEFNNYKLEIFKKYKTENLSTSDNVYITATANTAITKGDPIFIESNGNAVRAKASTSSLMPAIGIAYEDIPYGNSGQILISGYVNDFLISVATNAYVGENGGLTNTTTGLTQVQLLGVQYTASKFILFDQEVTLKGTGNPIKLNYNLVDDDMLSPFRSSYLDISFYKESFSDDYSELFAAENDAFKVTLKKNNVLFWQGWIGSQLFSEPFASPPYPISLRAYDGLHLLKNKPYFDDPEVFQATSNLFNDRYGYHNIVDVVEKCIYNTSVLNDVFYCINVSNSENSDVPTLFPVRSRIHHQTFLKGESNSMNMEEVLQMVLRSLGATIYQRDGDWCVIKISDFTLSPIPVLIKRSNWITGSTTETNYITNTQTYTSSDDVSKNINLFQVDSGSTMTIQYPLKEVTIEHEFDHNMVTSTTIDSVRDLGADDPSGTYLFTEWETSGTNIQEAVVLRKNETLSEAKKLPKSFIEADLGASGVNIDYCDSYLYYPVSHTCTVDSSKITGLSSEVNARPLGRSLVDDEAFSLIFSPKLRYFDGTTKEYGFGTVETFETSMINNKILRMNAEAFDPAEGQPLIIGGIGVRINQNSSSTSWRITITQNKDTFFTSQVYTTPANTSSYNDYFFGGGSTTNVTWLESFTLTQADYEVSFEQITGNPIASFVWYVQGYRVPTPTFRYEFQQWGSNIDFSNTSESDMTTDFQYVLRNDSSNPITITPREGGNIGTTPPNVGENDLGADNFRKTWDCTIPAPDYLNSTGFAASQIRGKGINQWTKYSITASQNWNSNISNLYLSMNIFGSAKAFDASGIQIDFPEDASGNPITTNPRYTDTYDVSYSDVKLYPLVTQNKFTPRVQEYKITQSANFSSKITKKVKIGSGLFNVGSNRYITFTSESGSTAKKSWDTFRDRRGLSATGVENATLQHLVGACYMELYRISVRRLDTTHYGNYKYGDKLMPIVNGTVETLNGSQGRFFPMNVVMDLKMARTSFSGDDLLDNTGTDWQTGLTKTIKWIGENDITETETLT